MLFKKKKECKECKKFKERIANLEHKLLVSIRSGETMQEEYHKKVRTLEREKRALQGLVKELAMEREEES